MNNIVLISAVYPPEPQVSASISFDLANKLAELNNHVTVLCPQPSRSLSTDYKKYINNKCSLIKFESGVKVVRLSSFSAPQSNVLPRIWESFSFGHEVIKFLKKEKKKPNIIYVNAWPLFAQFMIVNYASRNSIPIVLQIMDIYPEALLKKLPSFFRFLLFAPLLKLDIWISSHANVVVVISENMRRTYIDSRKISTSVLKLIPTWQDENLFDVVNLRSIVCNTYGIQSEPFTYLFLGNIGPVAGVDFIIRAFAKANITNSQLLIVGDGTSKIDCIKLAAQLNQPNIFFISDSKVSNVPILQSMAHVFMLPMIRGSGISSIPSKFASYLFSGKPVLASVDLHSDIANYIRQAECGWVGEPEDLDWMATKMKEVSQLSNEILDLIGQNGRNFGLDNFSKSTCLNRLSNVILKSLDQTYD